MQYLDPASLAPVDLSHARPGSLVLTKNAGTTWWLISHDVKSVAIAVSGQYAGTGFHSSKANNWRGLEYIGGKLEVDPNSATTNFDAHPSVLSLARSDTSLKLVYKHDLGEGRTELREAILKGGLPEASPDQAAYFPAWRVCVGEGNTKIVLLDVGKPDA